MTQADFVEAALGATETTETNLGTITVPNVGIRRIVGIYGIVVAQAITTAEAFAAYFKLSFKTVPGVFRFPATVYAGPAGTLTSGMSTNQPQIIPVDIPVPPNESVTCYMATFLATTGLCRGTVGLIME